MAKATHTTRRSLFAIAAAAGILSAAPEAYAAPLGSTHHQFVELCKESLRLTGDGWSEEEWQCLDEQRDRFIDAAEALPLAPENVAVKALAFLLIHWDDLETRPDHRPTTDARLALQIVETIGAAH